MSLQISVDLLSELIEYEPESGRLRWKVRPLEMFGGINPDLTCRMWNARNAGRYALNTLDGHGYLHGAIFGRNFKSARVAWALHYSRWPNGLIDHINGNRRDNRIDNLRDVDPAGNSRNVAMGTKNTSGHVGVYWCRRTSKWVACIKVGGKNQCIGRFSDKQGAVDARAAKEIEFRFHPNHGKRRTYAVAPDAAARTLGGAA